MWLGALFLFLCKNEKNRESPEGRRSLSKAKMIFWVGLFSFVQSLLAIFFFYEVYAYRGLRVLVPFYPMMVFSFTMGLWFFAREPSKKFNARKIAVSVCGFVLLFGLFGISNRASSAKLKWFQKIQSGRIQHNYRRVKKVMRQFDLAPKMVLSHENFYFPVGEFPSEVIWTLPRNLKQWEKLQSKVSIDLIELPKKSRLLNASAHDGKVPPQLPGPYRFLHQEGAFYYFVPSMENPPTRP